MSLGRREASWVHLSGCWSSGKIHVCGGPASGAHLCDCCSIGKMQACEGPVSVMHLFRCWHSFRIPPAVKLVPINRTRIFSEKMYGFDLTSGQTFVSDRLKMLNISSYSGQTSA